MASFVILQIARIARIACVRTYRQTDRHTHTHTYETTTVTLSAHSRRGLIMALALVRCSIEADQGGTPHARARISLVSWEREVMHCLWFRSVLRVRGPWPKRYGYHLSTVKPVSVHYI